MNYLVIKNGYVVKESAIITEDILVGGNKILLIDANIERPTSETPVIDATGKYIIPGAIDVNRHFLNLSKEGLENEELKKLNQAEIYNGTTTMLDAVEDFYEKNYIYNIYKAKEKARRNLIDYGFHLAFSDLKKNMANAFNYSYIHEGISTFLISVSMLESVEYAILESLVRKASEFNLLIICDLSIPELGKSSSEHIKFNNPVALKHHFNALSILIELGLKFDCPLMFLNVKFQEELDLIQKGLDENGDFYAGLSLPFSIGVSVKSKDMHKDSISRIASASGVQTISEEKIWRLVKNKRFLINPPSFNLTIEDDVNEDLVYNRPDKYFNLRNYLSMLYTVGVTEKHINILQLVDLVSTRPAKIMGLWPQKGVLKPGADADFVIWNPTFDRNLYCTISNSEQDDMPMYKLKGRADFVFAKGRMVYNGESFYPKHSDGTFVFRTAPQNRRHVVN